MRSPVTSPQRQRRRRFTRVRQLTQVLFLSSGLAAALLVNYFTDAARAAYAVKSSSVMTTLPPVSRGGGSKSPATSTPTGSSRHVTPRNKNGAKGSSASPTSQGPSTTPSSVATTHSSITTPTGNKTPPTSQAPATHPPAAVPTIATPTTAAPTTTLYVPPATVPAPAPGPVCVTTPSGQQSCG